MIDDFVKRPDTPKRRPTGKKTAESSDFLPDLSAPATVKPTRPSIKKETFVTPEEAAAQDTDALVDDVIDLNEVKGSGPKTPKDHWWNRLGAWFGALSKKKKMLVIALIILMLGGIGGGTFALTRPEAVKPVAKVEKPKAKIAPKPTTVPNTLTGRQVATEINKKPVIAVMIENSTDARPQSGLYDAGVVFEAIAEGGITRFVALYQDTEPSSIGPVRSARPYYIDWILGFDAAYAHAGGSPEALQKITQLGVKDMNDHKTYFQRVSNKFAPHNLYTSSALLNQYAVSKGYTTSDFTGFTRKADKASKAPTAKNITLNISSVKYNVSYTYDAATNSYLRNLAGAPHIDSNNSKQINPKVVVAMVMQYGIQADGKHSVYNTIGSGPVTIFQDGAAITGTWAKTSKESQITFTDGAGKPIALNAGQTWLTMVNNAGSIVSAP